jgi:hypothetical protein
MSMRIITAAALVAALAVPAMAANDARARTRAIQNIQKSTARASVDSVFDADARIPYSAPPQFGGYPTDYLMNRFGDRQLQGR